MGEFTLREFFIEEAIASDWPLSSASTPGKAPGVSINVTIGMLNLLAILKSL